LGVILNAKRETARGFRFPSPSDRVLINGRTGSGKTVGAAWLLANAPFDALPYVIVDYKDDALLKTIRRVSKITLSDPIPSDPGLYRLQPTPADDSRVTDWLWRVWDKTRVGLFFDEGYLIPASDALRTIYTTGRSRLIPTFTLSQRPAGLPLWATSETDFHWIFHVRKKEDRERIAGDTPFIAHRRQENDADLSYGPIELLDLSRRLPDYVSRWYDVGTDQVLKLLPVDSVERILERFERRLTPRTRFI
jgi:hypothetical protein